MKKSILTLLCFCFAALSFAQVYKTVNLTTAGSLSTVLSTTELSTITNLTVIGTIDARDFKTMRDNMPVLSVVDISGVTISSYTGSLGTYITSDTGSKNYPANTVPNNAFHYYDTNTGKISLTSIILPSSIIDIGISAFDGTTNLISINIPSFVTTIQDWAFWNCASMDSINIPSSVITIGYGAFHRFYGMIKVDINNPYYSSLGGVLFNKGKTLLIQCPVSKSGNYYIPSSVTTIGERAFDYCSNLTYVDIPTSVKFIKSYAFRNCSKLTSVTLPPLLSAIESYTFNNCTALVSIDIPPSVISIGENAFLDCSGLTSITIPPSVIFLEFQAFAGCISLISIYIPSSVKNISDQVFVLCSGLITVDKENTNYSSLDGVLFDKTKTKLIQCPVSKKGSYNIPSSVALIGDYSFFKCYDLTSIIIPSSVDSIGSGAFEYVGLKSVDIPSSVKSIGVNAFYRCSGLRSVNIPSSVTSVGDGAFSYCSGLTSIVTNGYPVMLGTYTFYGLNKDNCTLTVPYGAKGLYAVAKVWSDFKNIVEKTQGFIIDLKTVFLDAADSSSNTVNIKANMDWIAGSDQTWLKVNPISSSSNSTLTFIAESNQSVTNRTAIVTVSGTGVQSQTINVIQRGIIKTISISKEGTLTAFFSENDFFTVSNLKLIGMIDARDIKVLRDNMASLTDLDLSEVTILPYTGQDGTVSYGSYYDPVYPENEMPEGSFYKNHAVNRTLNSIILPNSITSIGDYAFEYCLGLTSVTIPKSVTAIGEDAFSLCVSLTDVPIPNSVTSIGQGAFSFCYSLYTLTIPNSVTNIGEYAFYGCSQLDTIYACSTLPNDLSQSQEVFGGLNKAKCTLFVPSGSINAYKMAAQWKDFMNIKEMKNLTLSSDEVSIALNGSTISITLSSDTIWTASSDQKWLMASPTSGINNAIITLSGQPNLTINSRTAIVTIKPKNGAPKTINVTQPAGIVTVSRSNVEMGVNEGISVTVNLTSNTAWTASSDKEWLTVDHATGSGDDVLTLKATVNQTSAPRTAVITVTIPLNGKIQTITVTQATLYTLKVTIDKKWNDVLICDNTVNQLVGYQWYKDDMAINGATQQFYYQPNGLSGRYFVEAFNANGERGFSNVIDISSVQQSKSLYIYPNPANIDEKITVEMNLSHKDLSGSSITIYSVNGETIRKMDNLQDRMTLQFDKQGTYILQLLSKEGIVKVATKFIVTR